MQPRNLQLQVFSSLTMSCSRTYSVFNYLHVAFTSIILIVAIYFTIQHFRNNHEKSKSATLRIFTKLFSIISLIVLTAFILKSSFECHDRQIYGIFSITWSISYYFQWQLLLLVLLVRLQQVFKDTPYKLNKCIIIINTILFIIICIGFMFALFVAFLIDRWDIYYMVVIAVLFYALLLSLFVTYLLIYKLYKVYQLGKNNDNDSNNKHISNKLATVMVKHTILGSISILSSFLNVINYTIWTLFFNHLSKGTYYPILNVFYLLDISTNFFCIMLALASNKQYYSNLCGGLHNKCILKIDKNCESDVSDETQMDQLKPEPIPSYFAQLSIDTVRSTTCEDTI